jgi:hypothetical protein
VNGDNDTHGLILFRNTLDRPIAIAKLRPVRHVTEIEYVRAITVICTVSRGQRNQPMANIPTQRPVSINRIISNMSDELESFEHTANRPFDRPTLRFSDFHREIYLFTTQRGNIAPSDVHPTPREKNFFSSVISLEQFGGLVHRPVLPLDL